MNESFFPKENLSFLVDKLKAALQTMTEVLEKRNTCYSALMFAPENQNNKLILARIKELDVEKMIERTLGQRASNC